MAALDVAKRRCLSLIVSRAASQRPFARRAFSGGGGGGALGAAPPPLPPTRTPEARPPPPEVSSLSRELRGWLRYMSPFSRYSATFYRTDGGIADRVVEMALLEAVRGAAAAAAAAAARRGPAEGGGSSSSGSGSGGSSSSSSGSGSGSGSSSQGDSDGAGAVLVDLGCGDGQIMRAALRAAGSGRFAVRRVVGHELCPSLAGEARRRCAAEQGPLGAAVPLPPPPPPRVEVEVVEGDAGDADLSEADAVFLYMSAGANARLLGPGPGAGAAAAGAAAEGLRWRRGDATRSARTLRPGAVVASLGFPVEGWDAWLRRHGAVESRGGSVPVYLYVAGGRPAGGGGGGRGGG